MIEDIFPAGEQSKRLWFGMNVEIPRGTDSLQIIRLGLIRIEGSGGL
jgi:hypothetical protein